MRCTCRSHRTDLRLPSRHGNIASRCLRLRGLSHSSLFATQTIHIQNCHVMQRCRCGGACRWMVLSTASLPVRAPRVSSCDAFPFLFLVYHNSLFLANSILPPPSRAEPLHRQIQRQMGAGASRDLEGGRRARHVRYSLAVVHALGALYFFNNLSMYRGLSINYIRVVPMVSISFTVYDLMKSLLEPL